MLDMIIYFIGIMFPVMVVYIAYKQNKSDSQYWGKRNAQLSKSYYLVLFLSSLYFIQYFIHLTIPNVDSMHDYLSIANQYLAYANGYFTFNNFINNMIGIYFFSIPLTIFIYISVNSISKLQSFEITLIFLVLIEPLQYVVNVITISHYHYVSILDMIFPVLGAGLGMIILFLIPQITNFKESIYKPVAF